MFILKILRFISIVCLAFVKYTTIGERKNCKGKKYIICRFGNFQKNELLKVDQHRGTFDSPKPQRQPKVSSTYI